MSRNLAIAICLSLLVAVVPIASAAPPSQFPAGAAGLGDPYFPQDGNGGYDVEHYDLQLTYNPARDYLTGRATIHARATHDLSAFNLDFVGLRLRSVTVDGASATTTRRGQELTVRPRTGITNGSAFSIVAQYEGVPQSLEEFGLSGFIHTEDGALVVGEPHVASSWFPANDHPRDKARFDFQITVPAGLEAIANGILVGQQTSGGWTTWTWQAAEPMATYLAMMAIGQYDVAAYERNGIRYWDAIATPLLEPLIPELLPVDGAQMAHSQVGDSSYKRLTRTIDVPPGGAQLTFDVNRHTEEAWDFFFVEARTAGGSDWTTLPDLNGHTSQEVGACPFNYLDLHPHFEHYVTPVLVDPGDPTTPDDDFYSCDPVGTTGVWHAISGASDGWESWAVQLPNAGTAPRQVEVSFAYASDWIIQGRGVALDRVVVSTGQGTTSFENDGNPLDGWVAPLAGPPGSPDNPNTWIATTSAPAVPGLGAGAQLSFDRQPEITAWEASVFGPYPFAASGGIVHIAEVGFALENQTRSTYSQFFFGPGEPNDFVVVHEMAHQWFGDDLTVESWQHIWLNEGFATYAEWMWSEREGFGTAEQIFNDFASLPAEEEWFWDLAIGDPGPDRLFDFPVYARGAMTLHALRKEVGDVKFFRILSAWAVTQAGGHVTTREFIDLAESIHRKDLDPLFEVWLSAGKPPIATRPGRPRIHVKELTPAARSLAERLADRPGQPFRFADGA